MPTYALRAVIKKRRASPQTYDIIIISISTTSGTTSCGDCHSGTSNDQAFGHVRHDLFLHAVLAHGAMGLLRRRDSPKDAILNVVSPGSQTIEIIDHRNLGRVQFFLLLNAGQENYRHEIFPACFFMAFLMYIFGPLAQK